jgi:hypothetical protein
MGQGSVGCAVSGGDQMSDVLISKTKLRELEISTELAGNLALAISRGGGDLLAILIGAQAALAQYEAQMALEKAKE